MSRRSPVFGTKTDPCRAISSRLGTFRILIVPVVSAFLISFVSCRTTAPTTESAAGKELAAAEAHLQAGRYTAALTACIDMARRDPLTPGLPELQNKVMTKLTDLRAHETALAAAQTHSRSAVDVDSRKRMPSTYGLDRFVEGQTNSLRSLPNSMEQVLRKQVSVHLDGVGLKDFVLEIGKSDNINIIVDGAIGGGGSLTLHADKVPLVEILDYVSRNLGVSFFVGENIIWATAIASAESGPPLITRIYKLRKGISNQELEDADTDLEKTITQFIPKTPNASVAFVRKTHTLFAKDTRENLNLIESILDSLDMSPRQVLIEARFLEIMNDSYHDLGVDWIINSPIGITTETVLRNGRSVRANSTQIDPNASLNNMLPRGEGASEAGMNLTYRGVLTDPMFRAVVRALEKSGKSRYLAAPRITTVNNRLAHMEDSLQEIYVERYVTTYPTTTNGVALVSSEPVPKELKTGISLDVTPSVGADERTISVRIVPTVRVRIDWEDFPYVTQGVSNRMRYPVVTERKIETEVMVQSGETVVLGGLIRSTEKNVSQRTPILSSIPLFGRLFRADTKEQDQGNLLIFVTATILSDRGENLLPLNTITSALEKEGGTDALAKTPETATVPAVAQPVAPTPPVPPVVAP